MTKTDSERETFMFILKIVFKNFSTNKNKKMELISATILDKEVKIGKTLFNIDLRVEGYYNSDCNCYEYQYLEITRAFYFDNDNNEIEASESEKVEIKLHLDISDLLNEFGTD